MNKAAVLVVLGLTAIFVQVRSITCPIEDDHEDSVYYPHETECGKFYECVAGKATLLECPEGLYWNSRLNVCDWNVDCGPLLTSTPSVAPPTSTTPVTDPDTTTEEITTEESTTVAS